ncbi:MAG: DUF4177 domain-containing protein [Rhodobacterales bacterium]
MDYFEYKVIPAPRNGIRIKGAKGPAGRYAGALEKAINVLAATGWEYLRAESLPMDERHGITMRKTETYQNVLVFRRAVDAPADITPVFAVPKNEPATDELFVGINDDYLDDEESIVFDEAAAAAEEKDDTKA